MVVLKTRTLSASIDAPFQQVFDDLAESLRHHEWATEFFSGPPEPTGMGYVIAQVPMMGGTAKFRVEA